VKKHNSALVYILKALIPYSHANLALSFKPSVFFNELEEKSNKSYKTLENAYYKAIKDGLIRMDTENIPRLTEKARSNIKLYKPTRLDKGAKMLIIFDIPESERWKRRHLRLLLKELSFQKVQQSVWICGYDFREYLTAEIKQYGLQDYVKVFECNPIHA
jgi:DNA-binding transcriptional regulator PaaX